VTERVEYDEFGLFHENAEEHGLPFDRPPTVRRVFAQVAPGRRLSALAWQDRDPELVFLHGGSQNAHTWDTVAMALDRPLVAIDLPGHGHSDGPGDRQEGQLDVFGNAADVAAAIRQLVPATPGAQAVIGMSLGGLTAIALAAEAPELVRKLVLVDVLPGIKPQRARHITDFVAGPPSFASLDELLERTVQFNPARSRSSLRRGILHNAEQQPDGTWVWRWARHRPPAPPAPASPASANPALASAAPASAAPASAAPASAAPASPEPAGTRYGQLWAALSAITVPLLLARGMRPDSVLDDDDERELLRRLPSAQVVHVAEAGHSLQGDTPLELAAIIDHFVFGS
jgi:pimeloyl-ACP methyl ester carboxylesterase